MKSVLTVVSNDSLMNRIKQVLNDKTIEFSFAHDGTDAAEVANAKEIAVGIMDFRSEIISGEELCELLLSFNSRMQLIIIFDEADTKEVISVYNRFHVNKLMCKEYLVLEDLPMLIEDCLHTYNREDEIVRMDNELKKLNEKYFAPMQEMSSILNERLVGYDYLIHVFRKSIGFVLNLSETALNYTDEFVDRIMNDYIEIYIMNEPEVSSYFSRLCPTFNKPDSKKFFRFVSNDVTIPDESKYPLLFVVDLLAIYFDIFYPLYRGRIVLENKENGIEINAIYEVRYLNSIMNIYDYIWKVLCNILENFSKTAKNGRKDNIIQFKVTV